MRRGIGRLPVSLGGSPLTSMASCTAIRSLREAYVEAPGPLPNTLDTPTTSKRAGKWSIAITAKPSSWSAKPFIRLPSTRPTMQSVSIQSFVRLIWGLASSRACFLEICAKQPDVRGQRPCKCSVHEYGPYKSLTLITLTLTLTNAPRCRRPYRCLSPCASPPRSPRSPSRHRH